MFPFTQKPLKYLYHWIAFLILLSEDKRQSIAACFVGDFDMPEVNAMYGTILTPESLLPLLHAFYSQRSLDRTRENI